MSDSVEYRGEPRTFRSVGRAAVRDLRDKFAAEYPPRADPVQERLVQLARNRHPSAPPPRLVDCGHNRPGQARCVCLIAFGDERTTQQIMDSREQS